MLSLTRSFIQNQLIDATHQHLTYYRIPEFDGGTSGTSAPFIVDSNTLVSNLNAEYLCGYTIGSVGTKVPLCSGSNIWSGQQTITSNLIVDTNTLFVDSFNHRVGIGTTSLYSVFNIQSGTNARLEFNSGESKGSIEVLNNSRTVPLDFSVYADNITFNTKIGGSGTYSEVMRIDSTLGNVGIGTTSPPQKLTVSGSIYANGTRTDTVFDCSTVSSSGIDIIGSSSYWGIRTGTSGQFNIDVYNSGTPKVALTVLNNGNVGIGTLAGTGNRAVYSDANGILTNSSSDKTLKTNVDNLSYGLAEVKRMRAIFFNWIDTDKMGTQREIGYTAQDMKEIIPEVVGTNSDGTLSIDYAKLVAVITNAITEIDDRISSLETKIN